MKRNVILFCTLLSLCICLTVCGNQILPELSDSQSAGDENITSGTTESETSSMTNPSLHVSKIPYALPSGSDSDSGGVNADLLIYHEEVYNSAILFDILGSDVVVEYGENTYKKMDQQVIIQSPDLYHMIHHFNVSLEDLLEASDTGLYGRQYNKEFLRSMYLPYEDMLSFTMNSKGAYLNGTVYNIQTLNELFEEDKDTFSRISLAELVEYQERLEEEGIDYGFNQDMVDFANQYCRRS